MALKIQILPSLLAADFGNLEAGARAAEAAGGDGLHIDIMDGHFVPNLSMGPDVVRMARRTVRLPLNVHLMITNPDRMAEPFAAAGAGTLVIHVEAPCNVPGTLQRIRELGVRPGITLRPGTPAETVFPLLDLVDEVLVMTVEPGYGGQPFMSPMLPKIESIRKRIASVGRVIDISVDGGIDQASAVMAAAAGANVFVAGTFLYKAKDMAAEVRKLRRAVTEESLKRW